MSFHKIKKELYKYKEGMFTSYISNIKIFLRFLEQFFASLNVILNEGFT